MAVSTASATGICTSATLDSYLGGSCTINGETFSNWDFGRANSGAVALTAAQIEVTPTYGTNTVTFSFGPVEGAFAVGSDEWTSYYVMYYAGDDRPIETATLGMVGAVTNSPGQVNLQECPGFGGGTVGTLDGRFNCTTTMLLSKAGNGKNGTNATISENLDPTSGQWFLTTVDLSSNLPAHGNSVGSAQLASFSNSFVLGAVPENPVPEPAAFGLVGLGLIALRFFRR